MDTATMVNTSPDAYSEERFLKDIRETAATIQAPFSESVTRRVLRAYADRFNEAAVLWKTSGRPGDVLIYRFSDRSRADTVEPALRAGLLSHDTEQVQLIREWAHWRGAAATLSCDFDAAGGLAKTYVNLGGTIPTEEVLAPDFVPGTLLRHRAALAHAGLDHIRATAVNHQHGTVNLYFRARGPISARQYSDLLAMASVRTPSHRDFEEIRSFLAHDFSAAVTISLDSGVLHRVGLYAPGLPAGVFPRVPERVARFFANAPSYDVTTSHVVGWSFGPGKGTYLKAEKSYCGDFSAFLGSWTLLSRSTQRDPALDPAGDASAEGASGSTG